MRLLTLRAFTYRGYPIVAACRFLQVVSAPTTLLNGQVNYDITAGFSAGTVTEGCSQARVIDPAQETTVLSLRQIAPAGFLTQAFALDWSAVCKS